MKMPIAMVRYLAALSLLIASGACSNHRPSNSHPELRKILDASSMTLRESVAVALAEAPGNAERATLETTQPAFSIHIIANSARTNVTVSPSGEVLSAKAEGSASFGCGDSISLSKALAIAENEASGEAIQSVPDDDVECAFEIQVLNGDDLIEVKVAPNGEVLEVEPSDEFSGQEDE